MVGDRFVNKLRAAGDTRRPFSLLRKRVRCCGRLGGRGRQNSPPRRVRPPHRPAPAGGSGMQQPLRWALETGGRQRLIALERGSIAVKALRHSSLCPVATEPGRGARKRCCVKGSCYRRWNLSRALPLMERNKMELGYEQHRLACWSRCHRYCGPQSGRVRLISNLKSCRQWRQSDQRRET